MIILQEEFIYVSEAGGGEKGEQRKKNGGTDRNEEKKKKTRLKEEPEGGREGMAGVNEGGWGGGRNPSGGSGTETEGINCSWERLSEGFGRPVGAACASTNAHMLKQREPGQAGAGPDAAAMLMRSGGSAQTVERRAP